MMRCSLFAVLHQSVGLPVGRRDGCCGWPSAGWRRLLHQVPGVPLRHRSCTLHHGLPLLLPRLRNMPCLSQYSIASAVGQNFIYFTITQFNPLVLSTVTTTRKIFSTVRSSCSRYRLAPSTTATSFFLPIAGILCVAQPQELAGHFAVVWLQSRIPWTSPRSC